MNDMSESVLVFGVIVLFSMISNVIIINKQKNSMPLDKMGIEIGKRCPNKVLEDVNGKKIKLNEVTGNIVFIEEDCTTCQLLVRDINANERKYDNIITILVGEREHAIRFIQKYPLWNKVTFMNKDEIHMKLNISAFPFYMKLTKGIVKEKGFAVAEKFLKD